MGVLLADGEASDCALRKICPETTVSLEPAGFVSRDFWAPLTKRNGVLAGRRMDVSWSCNWMSRDVSQCQLCFIDKISDLGNKATKQRFRMQASTSCLYFSEQFSTGICLMPADIPNRRKAWRTRFTIRYACGQGPRPFQPCQLPSPDTLFFSLIGSARMMAHYHLHRC